MATLKQTQTQPAPRRSARIAAKNLVKQKSEVNTYEKFTIKLKEYFKIFKSNWSGSDKEVKVRLIVNIFQFMLRNRIFTMLVFNYSNKFLTTIKNKITDLNNQIQPIRLPYSLAMEFHTTSNALTTLIQEFEQMKLY
jgi:hypothetical protein